MSGGTMPVCGNCGLVLNTSGTCSKCDYGPRQVRVLAWWEVLDIDWEIELAKLERLDSIVIVAPGGWI